MIEHKVVVSVNNPAERDLILRNICTQLECRHGDHYEFVRDRINRVKVFHKEDGIIPDNLRSHFCTYIVIIIPVRVDLDGLEGFSGMTDFRLDTTIGAVREILHRLELFQGKKLVKEDVNTRQFEELLRSLS